MTTLTTRNVVQQRKLAAITSAHTKAVLKNFTMLLHKLFL